MPKGHYDRSKARPRRNHDVTLAEAMAATTPPSGKTKLYLEIELEDGADLIQISLDAVAALKPFGEVKQCFAHGVPDKLKLL